MPASSQRATNVEISGRVLPTGTRKAIRIPAMIATPDGPRRSRDDEVGLHDVAENGAERNRGGGWSRTWRQVCYSFVMAGTRPAMTKEERSGSPHSVLARPDASTT